MIEITTWMNGFIKSINEAFGGRVWFVGLQGSYGRGEATETSDIDVVVLLRLPLFYQPRFGATFRAPNHSRGINKKETRKFARVLLLTTYYLLLRSFASPSISKTA